MTTLIPKYDLMNGGSTPTGAVNRSIQDKLSEVISVKDFGAKGDNATDDTAAIQAALTYAGTLSSGYARLGVFFPDGYYVITSSLQIPSWITMFGNTPNGCIINNQTVILTVPQCVAAGGANIYGLHVRNMTFRGGKSAFYFSAGMQSCVFEDVNMDLQTDQNMNTTDFEVNKFVNCIFNDAQYGIVCNGTGFVNFNNFVNCEFNNHSWSGIYWHTSGNSSVNNFYGCRFEGGGISGSGRSTIDVLNPSNLNFNGCYIEGTSSNAYYESGSDNTTKFDNCHFTYAAGSIAYNFVTDGIINFGNNTFYLEPTISAGAKGFYLSGINKTQSPTATNTFFGNNNLYFSYTPQSKKMVSKWIPTPASLGQTLLTFTRAGSSGATSNSQFLTGVLTIQFFSLEAGGFGKQFSRMYHVNVLADGFSTMVCTLNNFSSLDNASGCTLTVSVASGATNTLLTLSAVFTGLVPSTELTSQLQWSFEYIESSTLQIDTIIPALGV